MELGSNWTVYCRFLIFVGRIFAATNRRFSRSLTFRKTTVTLTGALAIRSYATATMTRTLVWAAKSSRGCLPPRFVFWRRMQASCDRCCNAGILGISVLDISACRLASEAYVPVECWHMRTNVRIFLGRPYTYQFSLEWHQMNFHFPRWKLSTKE